MLEVEVPPGVAGEKTGSRFGRCFLSRSKNAKRRDSLQKSVSVNFSKKREEVKRAVNQPVMDSAAEQVVNEISKKAVELRDQGKTEAAKSYIQQGMGSLKENLRSSGAAPSPRFEALEQEVQKDADELDDNRNWNKKRKSMRQRQFKYDNQQKY